jgi:hypothetical protein
MEDAGISTVIIAVRAFRDHLAKMTLPRVVTTPYPMGRPLGAPGDDQSQRESILSALDLLESAGQVGTILDLTGSYTPVRRRKD